MSNATINLGGVAGIDGVVPVYEPDGRWTQWRLSDIFIGPMGPGAKRYVPKVDDWVIDTETMAYYEVVSIDPATLAARLKAINPLKQDQTFSNADLILGVGPGSLGDTFRAYLNKNVIPYTLTVDSRLHSYTAEAESFTIFRGNDVPGSANPISQLYNPSNQLIGTSIPMVLAAITGDNRTIKSYPTCYTIADMASGEVVTMITYSDTGHQVSKVELKVEESQLTPLVDASNKYVTNISLESPWISPNDPNVLQFPMNLNMSGLSLVGVVSYNDGSVKRYPVNNTVFSLRGLDDFVSTYAGQKFNLVLDYKLQPGDVALGVATTPAGSVTRLYSALTTNFEGMYSPKLFAYPVWIDPINGYRLEWWLYDMERRLASLVTPFVKVNANSQPFQPIGYGYKQTLGVTINLRDVNPSGLAINHVQVIDIVLRQPGDGRTSNWAVGFIPNQSPLFGEGNAALMNVVDQNQMKINIACGETVKADWLERIYYRTMPLTDQGREARPPAPTHFALCTKDWEVDYPIDQWDQTLTSNYTIANSGTIFIKFFVRTPDTDIQLSIAAMPVYAQ